ncbi:MAG TPA: RNA polymerase sigma factor [Vicinamibacterales bacterium]|jgi:RNA polymerase sigma-70 factor, ECF subfamily|nr:RNA polymerase sigma factor [Vicinamibacterales bacterium]
MALSLGMLERRVRMEAAQTGDADEAGTVAALVDGARAGDRSAFGSLFERFAPMVHGILLARVRPQDADDLTQEVFLSGMQQLHTLREARAFGGWIATIARNAAVDLYRRSPVTTELPPTLAAPPPPAAEAAEVLRAIRELPDAYRETLILRLVEGMSGPEIAAKTGLAAGSVRVNLHRGMKLLRERLNGSGAHA